MSRLTRTEIDLSKVWNPNTCEFSPETVSAALYRYWWVMKVIRKPESVNENGVVVAEYGATVVHLPHWNAKKIIRNVVCYYSQQGERTMIKSSRDSALTTFDTGAHRYLQYIAGDTPKNRTERIELVGHWRDSGVFERVITHENTGWIYAYAVRRLIDDD